MKLGERTGDLNDIGPLLKLLRTGHGWTQNEVVRRLNLLGWPCTRSRYGKIESPGVQALDSCVIYFGRVFDEAFREAFWRLPLRRQPEDE